MLLFLAVIYKDRQRKSAQLTKTRWKRERERERERIFFDNLLGGPKINVLEEGRDNILF